MPPAFTPPSALQHAEAPCAAQAAGAAEQEFTGRERKGRADDFTEEE